MYLCVFFTRDARFVGLNISIGRCLSFFNIITITTTNVYFLLVAVCEKRVLLSQNLKVSEMYILHLISVIGHNRNINIGYL